MALPLLQIAIVTLGCGALWSQKKREKNKGKVTIARAAVYENALNELKDPDKLRRLAAAFRSEGLNVQADLLEKRAKLRELPQEIKEQRREAFRKGMASHDAKKVLNLASAFESQGATGAAKALRDYAMAISNHVIDPEPRVQGEVEEAVERIEEPVEATADQYTNEQIVTEEETLEVPEDN